MTAAGDIVIRKIPLEEEERARRFFTDRYPPAERAAAFERRGVRWRWQYFDHPGGDPGIWIAELDGRIVGIIGTNVVRIRTPKGIARAVWAGDLLIDPGVRGRGIGKKLVDAWKNSGAVGIGKGYNDIAYSLYVNRGFRGVHGFTRMHIVLSRARFVATLLGTGERRRLLRLLKVIARPIPSLDAASGFSISVGDRLPEDAQTLWRSVAARYRFAFERDSEYLAWRFLSHPAHRYRFIEGRDRNALWGLAIVRPPDEEDPMGVVLDLIVDPGDERGVLALLTGALALLREGGACAAIVDLPPALAPIAAKAFPCALSEDLSMVVHAADPDLVEAGIYDPAAWYLSRSDSDSDY